MLIEGIGTIKFNVQNKTKKHEEQSSWKKVAIIHTYDDLVEYYS